MSWKPPKNLQHALIGIGVLAVAIYWLFRIGHPVDARLRVALVGLCLQIFGVGTVAWGIHKARRRLHKKRAGQVFGELVAGGVERLAATLSSFLRNLKSLGRKRHGTVEGAAAIREQPDGAIAGGAAIGFGATARPSRTLQDRVQEMETQLRSQAQAIKQLTARINEEVSARDSAVKTEQDSRARADLELWRLIDDLQTDGVILNFVGLIWLAVGIVLSGIPGFIACVMLGLCPHV